MKRAGVLWILAMVAVISLLLAPATHNALISSTRVHPLAMGFLKFAILATLGEILGLRMRTAEWKLPSGLPWRMLVWGILGALIALMFQVFNAGAQAAMNAGMLPGKGSSLQTLITAFWISTIMNTTFGPAMMAAHRLSDAYIELGGGKILGSKVRFRDVIAHINWHSFFSFVIGTTIPLLWIPAHTLTFLAPQDYRVLIAALLSVVFGAVLGYAARDRKASTQPDAPLVESPSVSISS